jgi:hypothetical protein
MRFAITVLAALALVSLAGCGGEDDAEPAEPTETAALAQRVVNEEDAPGSKSDPVEIRETTADFDEFIDAVRELAVDPDTEEVTDVFTQAGFVAAMVDTRFFGETHTRTAPHVTSSVIQVESELGAKDALEWVVADDLKPCPGSCAVRISEFDVEGIPDAKGVRRSASAEDIEALGNEEDRPFESYRIDFTDGSFVYTVDLHGPPGSVTEDQATDIARAFYERVDDLSS